MAIKYKDMTEDQEFDFMCNNGYAVDQIVECIRLSLQDPENAIMYHLEYQDWRDELSAPVFEQVLEAAKYQLHLDGWQV